MKILFRNPIFHLFLIAIVGLLVYSNTFYVPFQFDDRPNIVENYRLKDLSRFWPPEGSRWLGFLTFAFNYHIGGLNVTGYHIFNLIIHILNAVLVYFLVVLTFKTPYFAMRSSEFGVRNSENNIPHSAFGIPHFFSPIHRLTYLPLFSALLFVSHPIQTQAVTYIWQRVTSLATFFYLLSLVMYIKFRIHDTKKIHDAGYTIHDKENHTACIMDRGSCIVSRASCIMYLASLFSAVLAMVTKEISFTLPFIIIFYEFCFLSKPLVWQPQVGRSLYLIPFLLILIIIPLNFILHSEMIDTYGTDAVEELRMLQLEDLTTHSKYEYLLTQFRAISTYIRLLFFPINQNLDYDYPIHNSFFEPQVVLSFLFLLSIFGLGVHLFYRSRFTMHDAQCTMHGSRVTNHGLRLISFGILWFFITLSVESSIIPIKDVIFEHRLYLPSIGAFIAINIGLFIFVEKLKQRWKRAGVTVIIIFAVGVIILTGAAYTRNIVWKDKLSLWSDVVRKSPEKERGYNGLANAYSNRGWDDKAIEYYQTAILLKPDSPISHYNLGMAYEKKGLIDKAITEYQSAIILNQGFVNAHNNLGLVYFKKGWTDKAIEHYQIALRLNPDDAETHNNLGTAYSSKDLTEKAAEHYRIALKLKPYYPVAHFNLGLIHLKNNDLDEARKEFESTLRIKPDHHQARQFLNYVYNLERPLTTR